MSCDAQCLLLNDVHEYVALCVMQGRRAPSVSVAWDLSGGTHALTIRVDGSLIVRVGGPSLECAARRALEVWQGWANDSEAGITNALERTLGIPANTVHP